RREPHVARARLYETVGNLTSASEAYGAAAARGADPVTALEALRRIAAAPGAHAGRTLLALGGAARDLGVPAEAAAAFEKAALHAPDLMDSIRDETEALVSAHPGCGEALLARARLSLRAQDPAAALRDAERLMAAHPGRWRDARDLAE